MAMSKGIYAFSKWTEYGHSQNSIMIELKMEGGLFKNL